ncbi:MAG: MAPEG family protein [Methylotenera sp.]|nr:MAPEG family protein [Methylotenera sp.]
MAVGLVISLLVVCFGSALFIRFDTSVRISSSLLLPVTALCVAIARLAKQRFFTPADIDGSALTSGTDRAKLLQALLQNTLEQLTLAIPVYLAALFSSSNNLQAAVPVCAFTFLLGRILFFTTYQRGAGARALGFALTFYPTVLLLIWQLWLLLSKVVF